MKKAGNSDQGEIQLPLIRKEGADLGPEGIDPGARGAGKEAEGRQGDGSGEEKLMQAGSRGGGGGRAGRVQRRANPP